MSHTTYMAGGDVCSASSWYLSLTREERYEWSRRDHPDYKYIVTKCQTHEGWIVPLFIESLYIPGEGRIDVLDRAADQPINRIRTAVTVFPGFCFDGPSGPMVDTPSAMLAAAFHDFLYRCNRHGHLVTHPSPQSYLSAFVDPIRWRTDALFGDILHDEATNRSPYLRPLRHFRAFYASGGVHLGGAGAWRTR